ncbi:hemolysin-III related-domain-containing protein [Calycina marina]|uniref:Hemolysin-III related-domain-containing protein n=1 Tax=Calycina marina TaxID=1763456 RepID=A0A9P7Z8V9_9HELO|nr:hemolysin-III related-domain-containing protein [Calycina marina]
MSHSRKRAPPRPSVSETALRRIGYNKPSPGWPAGKDSPVDRILLLTWHELLNIYSHLFGGVLFAILPFYVYSTAYPRYSNAQLGDIVVFSTFFFGVAVCFFLSASFHTFANHSEAVAALGNQLDYMGVVVLMWGSTIPSVYYGFYCDPELQKLYWSVVSVLAIACITTTLNPRFRHPQLRPYRAAMYSGLGLSAIVFIIHGLVLHGWELQNRRMSLGWMGLMGALNLIGAAAYAARIPERWYPLRHDIYGSSHQILHFMVVFAGLTHMVGLMSAFDYLHTQISPCV